MQQTTNYKLNKPGMDDTFAVGPLNENADTLDRELARVDAALAVNTAEHCLFKLAGPVTTNQTTDSMDFSLPEGTSAGEFAALIFVGTSASSYGPSFLINSSAGGVLLGAGHCMGFTLLSPFTDGTTGLCSVFTCLTSPAQVRTDQRKIAMPWADIQTFHIYGASTATFTVYGLKN